CQHLTLNMHLLSVTTFLLMLTVSQLAPFGSLIIECKEQNGEVNDCKHAIEGQGNSKGRSLDDHPTTLQSNYEPEEPITSTNTSEPLIVPILAAPAVGTLSGGGLG
ncbi:hypothetical protein ILUMI_19903, partial [Ignelater luminosus]